MLAFALTQPSLVFYCSSTEKSFRLVDKKSSIKWKSIFIEIHPSECFGHSGDSDGGERTAAYGLLRGQTFAVAPLAPWRRHPEELKQTRRWRLIFEIIYLSHSKFCFETSQPNFSKWSIHKDYDNAISRVIQFFLHRTATTEWESETRADKNGEASFTIIMTGWKRIQLVIKLCWDHKAKWEEN